jgi:hypothetical protein
MQNSKGSSARECASGFRSLDLDEAAVSKYRRGERCSDIYELGKLLGRGGYASVHMGVLLIRVKHTLIKSVFAKEIHVSHKQQMHTTIARSMKRASSSATDLGSTLPWERMPMAAAVTCSNFQHCL